MALIKNYVAPTKALPYDDEVLELKNAGPDAAYAISAPTVAIDGDRGSIVTERAKFQRAARNAGFTARVVSTESADGVTVVTFVATPLNGVKDAADVEVDSAE